jgi:DNA-binding NtrC family response regulator
MARICRVLVVEDNDDIRSLLEDVFEHEGYRFAMAQNGEAMRRALDGGDVDVVVIDVHLHGESGMALAEDAAGRGCAVVMTTGDHAYRDQLEAAGRHYILKPYRLHEMLTVVEQALEAVRARCATKSRQFGT